MLLDQPQPFHLFSGKVNRTGVAAESPLFEVVVYPVGKRRKGIRIAHLKTDNRNQVGQLSECAFLYLVRLLDGITIPQTLDRDARCFEFLIQFGQIFQYHRTFFIRFIVDDAQGNDLIFIFLDEILECRDHPVCRFLLIGIITSKEYLVQIDAVDDLIMAAADIFNKIAHFRLLERCNGLFDELFLGLCKLFRCGRKHAAFCLRFGLNDIFIKGIQQILRNLLCGLPHGFFELLVFAAFHPAAETNHTVCKRSQSVLIPRTECNVHHQFLHGNRWLAFQRAGLGLFGFGYTHCIHDHKVIFVFRSRRCYLL